MDSGERLIDIESVKIPNIRDNYGVLANLGESIRTEGLRHPITVWSDGTLISGSRRLRAHFMLGGQHRHIQAVFVSTIEEAAKRLLADTQDDRYAVAMKASEMCRLWEIIRTLDAPAATQRMNEARRRGVELRRQTVAGARRAGRASHAEDYVLRVMCEPFGMSEATAGRLWKIYSLAWRTPTLADDRREQARAALQEIDAGRSSIWANYSRLVSNRTAPVVRLKPVPLEAAPGPRQRMAWERSLPQMEGLVAGLVELGPPSADLTWEQVGPVHARLMSVRRDLEKIIRQMKESKPS